MDEEITQRFKQIYTWLFWAGVCLMIFGGIKAVMLQDALYYIVEISGTILAIGGGHRMGSFEKGK